MCISFCNFTVWHKIFRTWLMIIEFPLYTININDQKSPFYSSNSSHEPWSERKARKKSSRLSFKSHKRAKRFMQNHWNFLRTKNPPMLRFLQQRKHFLQPVDWMVKWARILLIIFPSRVSRIWMSFAYIYGDRKQFLISQFPSFFLFSLAALID